MDVITKSIKRGDLLATDVLTTTGIAVLNPLVSLWESFVNIVPGIIGAILILIIGYFIAYILGHAVRLVLEKLGLDRQLGKAHVANKIGKSNVSAILGELIKWYIFIIFIGSAVDLLRLGNLSQILTSFVLWLPHLIAGILVVLVGVLIAHYVEFKMIEHTKMRGMELAAKIVKIIIFFIIAVLALAQIGIDVSFLEWIFLILVGAVAVGITIALGISFGHALKGEGKNMVNYIKKNF